MARTESLALFLVLVVWVAGMASLMGPGRVSAQGVAPAGGLQANAAQTDSVEIDGSHLEISLMTIGPGDEVWERFSHNAIVIRDDLAQTEVAYNWGIFDAYSADFWPRLARGRMRYSMQGFPSSAWLEVYRRANREVWLQSVNLTPAERLELQALVQEMDTEANRYYRYDYYRDNCSTRVRDVLDKVLGGQIRSATEDAETGTTYRWHTARLLQSVPAAYAGIQFVVGNRGDEPISAWEEMFLPLRLKDHLDGIRIVDAQGATAPLLGEAVQVVEAVRDPLPQDAPDFLVPLLLLGTAVGVFFAGLGRVAGGGTLWARWALALSGAVWSAGLGLLGAALLLSWVFTDHVFWAVNENAFQVNPLSLILAVLLIRGALNPSGQRDDGWAGIRVVGVAKVVAGVALVGFVLQVLPGFDQVNGEVLAVMLPAHVGLAWGVLRTWPPIMV